MQRWVGPIKSGHARTCVLPTWTHMQFPTPRTCKMWLLCLTLIGVVENKIFNITFSSIFFPTVSVISPIKHIFWRKCFVCGLPFLISSRCAFYTWECVHEMIVILVQSITLTLISWLDFEAMRARKKDGKEKP